MATYTARIESPLRPPEAFPLVGDMRRFDEWDPSIVSAVQVAGDGPGTEAAYDITVSTGGRETTFRYEVRRYQPDQLVEYYGRSRMFTSIDVITVEATDTGCTVVYDAVLQLPVLLRVFDPLLAKAFERIGDEAAAGLARKLNGSLVGDS